MTVILKVQMECEMNFCEDKEDGMLETRYYCLQLWSPLRDNLWSIFSKRQGLLGIMHGSCIIFQSKMI